MNRRIPLLLTVGAGLLAACSSSTTIEPDAGITFDASMPTDTGTPDADVDSAMPPTGDIGNPCSSDADCTGSCVDALPGGYCTNVCRSDADCPGASSCIPVGRGQSICFANCDPAATERTCRAGYGCSTSFRLPGNVCYPGCADDSDCSGSSQCDPTGGGAGAGACFDPAASIGDACTDDAQCPASGFCLGEDFAGWPGGACIGFGCDPASGTGCADGSVCIPAGGGGGGGACVEACTIDSDCRDSYSCGPSSDYPDRLFCQPGCRTDADCSGGRVCNPTLGTCDVAFDSTEYGQPCSTVSGACRGGTCMTEFESGFPGSYCAYSGCDPSAADAGDGCPGDGVCSVIGGEPTCLDGCTNDSDCRTPDYACLPVDAAQPDRGSACTPSCTSDAACANDGTMGAPLFSCNPGTGLCRDPFEAARLGEPCVSVDDCPGGSCLTEASDGYPSGTCAAIGCRLSGTGPEQACPAAGVCVDDGAGDAELGACLVACVTSASGSCRPGYACVATGSSTDGACRPACASDADCTGSRTCTVATGLCG